MRKFKVGVLGATGMVGQRFLALLENHSMFEVVVVAASGRSAGKRYETAVRWVMPTPMPPRIAELQLFDAANVREVSEKVDFVFSAIGDNLTTVAELEKAYAKSHTPVVSNTAAHRKTQNVPVIIPEVNPEHIEIIAAQRREFGTDRGFIVVKPSCSLQSYVPAIHPLMSLRPTRIAVALFVAASGAGLPDLPSDAAQKVSTPYTIGRWPEYLDNVIPLAREEETKGEAEPLKIWGTIEGDAIVEADSPEIQAQFLRVPVTDGHTAAVFLSFAERTSKAEIVDRWNAFVGEPQRRMLPSAPLRFLIYNEASERPQVKEDLNAESGMAISIGHLREVTQHDYSFVALSHNTIRGAAGGAVLTAELLVDKGYIERRSRS